MDKKEQHRLAHSKFLAMAATYCLGVYNDNFFKQTALLLAVTTGMNHLQGPATVLFSLPFILFSAYAGWVADKYAKRNVVKYSKGLEVIAMLIGAAGIISTNWPCILTMIFLMSLQSTFFGPSLNGSIPELYREEQVAQANGVLKLVTTLSILAGIAMAGVCLDVQWPQHLGYTSRHLVALVAVAIAILGFLASFGVHSKDAADSKRPFPLLGPIHSLHDVAEFFQDPPLRKAILADMFFYFIASLVVLAINTFGLEALHFSQSLTSLLSAFLMLGISAGSLTAARFFHMSSWDKFLRPGAIIMVLGLLAASTTNFLPVSYQKIWVIGALIIAGCGGGIFLIPITCFLQIYPGADEKGRVLGAAGFCSFVGIMCSGFTFSFLSSRLSPATNLAITGLLTFCYMLFLMFPAGWFRKPLAGIFFAILKCRYQITVTGLDTINTNETEGTLILPNHPALIDPVIIMCLLYRKGLAPRPLSDHNQISKPFIRQFMTLINPIIIPDMKTTGRNGRTRIQAALHEMAKHLNAGDDILLYPAGKLRRAPQEDLGGNSAVEYLLQQAPRTRVITVRTTGLWGSCFSRAGNLEPSLLGNISTTLKFLFCNALIFGPKRTVHVEFIHDTAITGLPSRPAINAHLEAFYNANREKRTQVPLYWWQGRNPVVVAEELRHHVPSTPIDISSEHVKEILHKIEEVAGQKVSLTDRLTTDLALDSLTIMELGTWIEQEYGTQIDNLEALSTVEQAIQAAQGSLVHHETASLIVEETWFCEEEHKLTIPAPEPLTRHRKDTTITKLFLTQAQKMPQAMIIADQIAGCKSYRDILTSVFALRPIFSRLSGDNVGIMLPATASASISYLAMLFSGKIPVMFNWTVGIGNMQYGIELTQTRHIVTSKQLYVRIIEQGIALDTCHVQWLFLEDIIASISLRQKLQAVLQARFSLSTLPTGKLTDLAAILFTSGSESRPKAVPLSHANILANLYDIVKYHNFTSNDCLLGMLPPFHSLGLSGTVVLPICLGLRTVFHANPTESSLLARVIEAYHTSIVISTPTFLDNILHAGRPEQLVPIRRILCGAEKCPDTVRNLLRKQNSKAELFEGYGVTECSPLISLNPEMSNRAGSIGKLVPSLIHRIINPETGALVAPGERGLLLVRGMNVFTGYLGEKTDKGFIQHDGAMWYNTGDFVREDQDGFLFFCGRQKRFIKLGGEMISLPAIEEVLLTHLTAYADASAEGGPCCAVEAEGNEQHPLIILFTTLSISRNEVNTILRREGFSALHNVRKIIQVHEIPVLGTGKTDYRKLKEMRV